MDMENFDDSDISLMQEALDALQGSFARNRMMGDMFGMMLAPDKETREKLMAERQAEEERQKDEDRLMKERIVLLKAKLIQMRSRAEINRVMGVHVSLGSRR